MNRVVEIDPANILAPGVAPEPARVDVEPRPLRFRNHGEREIDPADVLTPREPGERAGRHVQVHTGVAAHGVAIALAVGGSSVTAVDPSDVLAPDESGKERCVEPHSLTPGRHSRVVPVEPTR